MSDSPKYERIAKGLAGFTGILAVAFLCGFTSLVGANVAGLRPGGWNLHLLPPIFYGWVGGFAIALISAVIAAGRNADPPTQVVTVLFAPLGLTFVGSIIFTWIALAPARQEIRHQIQLSREQQTLLADIKAQPETLRSLIASARTRPLSAAENGALIDALSVRDSVQPNEIPFLLDYFTKNGSALSVLMAYQPVTAEHLRLLYERHKNSTEFHPVVETLLIHPLTPPDVLEELARRKDYEYLARQARERLSKTPAKSP